MPDDRKRTTAGVEARGIADESGAPDEDVDPAWPDASDLCVDDPMVGDLMVDGRTGEGFVEVQQASMRPAPDAGRVCAWVAAVLDAIPRPGDEEAAAGPGEVCVRFVDDEESAALNAQYRGKSGPTNVLSFPADVDVPGLRVWGDIVICVPRVEAEAVAQGKTPDAHFTHLVVHGVLHLLGYDHQVEAEAIHMESLETMLLDRLGLADPYASPDGMADSRDNTKAPDPAADLAGDTRQPLPPAADQDAAGGVAGTR